MNEPASTESRLPIPAYVLNHGDPAGLFSRLQRVAIHLELLQSESVREFDISFRDFVILATLRKEPEPHELPVSQIAEYVLRPMGSISQALDRVEKAGLVVRRNDQNDRRKVFVALTPAGERFADEVLATYDDIRRRVFKRLTFDDQEAIDGAISTLLMALDTDYADGHP